MRISFAAAALLAFDFVAELLDRLADLFARLPKLLSRSADGALMPTNKDQQPPDLRYFPQARK